VKGQVIVRVRERREAHGLSQAALAERAEISRQALIAIEAGRQVPSTAIALRLADVLSCRVEDLFGLERGAELTVRGSLRPGARALVGRVGGAWVAHGPARANQAADAVALRGDAEGAVVEPLFDVDALEKNVFIAGCAPILGLLGERLGVFPADVRLRWLPVGSTAALDRLKDESVHFAGCHLVDRRTGECNVPAVRARFEERMYVVNLVRWRQGLLLAPGNPLGVEDPSELLQRSLRIAWRERGSEALKLLLRATGVRKPGEGLRATSHVEVAQAIALGAADAGVAIESEAIAHGLDFLPLTEERFDLVVPARWASDARVRAVLDALDRPHLRSDIQAIGGYDASSAGHVATVEGAA
jgi:putative molybdopterin biosynthesis protein